MTIYSILDGFDSADRPLAEVEIRSAIRPILTEPPDTESAAFAEFLAFSFVEEQRPAANGCPYSPVFEQPAAGGGRAAFPTPEQVTPTMIAYWESRAHSSRHPVMRARYAGLVWHLKRRVSGAKPGIEMARIAIDAVVDMAARSFHIYPSDVVPKLRGARDLALGIRDDARVQSVRDAIIAFDRAVGEDNKSGLWGVSFDLLVREDGVNLEPAQYEWIISDLEGRLEATSKAAKPTSREIIDAKSAAMRLARHYRRKGKPDDVKRVLLRYGGAVLRGREGQMGSSAAGMLRDLRDTYREFGLRDDLPALEARLREAAEESVGEMRQFRHPMRIDKKELRDHIDEMTAGTLDDALHRIGAEYVPSRQMLTEQVREIGAATPLQALMGQQVVDRRGRKLAGVGSIIDDEEGRVILHLVRAYLPLQGIYMRAVMEDVVSRLKPTAEAVVDHLSKSPVFPADTRDQLRRGIEAYLQRDHVVALHLLLARIEECARTVLELSGGSVMEPGRNGGEMLRSLDKVLADAKTVEALGEDAAFYLRALLCDPRGFNLRNEVYHGLAPDSAYQQRVADSVFHAILIFGTLRAEAPGSADAPEPAPPGPERPPDDGPVT